MAREKFDISNEYLIIGCFYSEPDLYVEYGKSIRSKYDFFDDSTKFLYDSFELYYKSFSQQISEEKLNAFMIKENDRKKKYMQLEGWKTISKAINMCDIADFENYYDTLKKYSLIRELDKKGFPIQRLLDHPKFDKIKSNQIIQSMRGNLDKIQTVIGGKSETTIVGKDMREQVKKWREEPAVGIPLPFEVQSFLFRGWRKGKLIVDGMLSNEGKSRKLSLVASYTSLILGKPILVMVNEMSEEDMKAAMLTTVCNNPIFGFELNVPERNIVTGKYDSEEQFESVMEVAEYFEEHTKIYFQDMASSYSDDDIDFQCRKHVLGLGVEYVFYDTLKGYKTDNWETVKQTTTKLRDVVSELKVGGYATIQLTDESLFINIFDFSSNNIANAKQLKHVVDHLILEKKLHFDNYNKYLIQNEEWGGEMPLQKNVVYYGQKIDKNRAGAKGMVLVQAVDLDLNTWKEVGFLIKNRNG